MKYYNRELNLSFKDYLIRVRSRINISNFPGTIRATDRITAKTGVPRWAEGYGLRKIICLRAMGGGSVFTNFKDEYFTIGSDNKFAYFTVGDIAASIVAYKKSALVMSLSAIKSTRVRVLFYPIVPEDGALSVQNNIVSGCASARAVIKGEIIAKDYDVEFRDRYEVVLDGNAKNFLCQAKYAST